MSALRVGLTGGLASGKSTVARMLAERGATVIDADRLVADLYRAGEPGARAAAELFGPEVLEPGGGVDRARLAERIFTDPAARLRLERVVHPLVRERFAELARAAEGAVVLEATLLVEAGYAPDFDRVVTVEADPGVRLARAVERGMSEPEARRRLAAQGEGVERRAAADVVIENDGDRAELERQVGALWLTLKRDCA